MDLKAPSVVLTKTLLVKSNLNYKFKLFRTMLHKFLKLRNVRIASLMFPFQNECLL